MRIIVVLLISGLLFVKCYTPSYKQELKNVDSLKLTLTNMGEKLKKVDSNLIDAHFKVFINNMNALEKMNMKKVNDSIKMITDEYRIIGGEFFKKYKMQLKNYNFELNKSKEQLENLESDLTNGRLAKSSFDGYYKMEKKASEKIIEEIEMYCKYTNNYIKKFEELNPKIEKLIKNK